MVDAETAKRAIAAGANVLRVPVHPEEAAVLAADVPKLGGEDDRLAAPSDGPAHKFLVLERTVHVGRVKERDTESDRPVDRRYGLLLVPPGIEL